MNGYINSVQSFGAVDGPGVRYVVFMQGCPLRCSCCHNPDTWDMRGGEEHTVEDLLEQYESLHHFYKNGGIPRSTISVTVDGKYKTVKLDTIYQIVATLGISLKEFFDDTLFDEIED